MQHIEDVSLCGLFLLDAAKKADELFGVHKPSTRHTVRDAQGDITKLCSYLIDNKASKEDLSRTSILTFDDPETKGPLPTHNSLLIKVENCLANCKAVVGGLLGTRL